MLDLLLSKQKEVTFVSRAGKMYGMDSDTELTFLPGRKVHLTEYGFAVADFEGVFTTDAEGSISLQLEKRRFPWPLMVLQFAKGEYYLHTKAGAAGFVMGNRAGATESSDMKPFWPFKLMAERKTEPNLEGCVRPERSGAVNTTIVEQAPASPEAPQGRPD